VSHETKVGTLENAFLREKVSEKLLSFRGFFTDLKFKIRGKEKPKNKVVIVEVDSESIEVLGRWPWHRDHMGQLIHKSFEAGAKVVGLDIVFSEPDVRIPQELATIMGEQKLGDLIHRFETDYILEEIIKAYSDKLVLGWTTENSCRPKYLQYDKCPVTHPEALKLHPKGHEKFAYTYIDKSEKFDPQKTDLVSLVTFITNIEIFNAPAKHSGYFSAFIDPDGVIRRTSMVTMANGTPYPSLPLEMARVGLKEDLSIKINQDGLIDEISFAKSKRKIPVTPPGVMEINFRGGSRTFQYIPALDVMDYDPENPNTTSAGRSVAELIKDAYVLIGVSALGVFDMRTFPFESNVAGVEGHANILDNILADDPVLPTSDFGEIIIYIILTVGALAFAYLVERLGSIPAVLMSFVFLGSFGYLDVGYLFKRHINWNTGLIYIEFIFAFVLIIAIKYILEEKNKKFIKGAFAKYVAPAIVDSIIKDPSKLSVGGEKRELTILFSDIRSFTTISEKMDAKALAGFLNDYLGRMTGLIFENQGTLDKYIGDAVMAFWGAPIEQALHADNACKTAIRMIQVLDEVRPYFLEKYQIDVQIGIGLNSGNVNVGNMGSEAIFEYTVIGDDVNLASRLEGLTKEYKSTILTTRATIDCIKRENGEIPHHRVLDFVKVKGKHHAVELIQLLTFTHPKEVLDTFENARTLYTNQKWDEAIKTFEESIVLLKKATNNEDSPAQMYIKRCGYFKENPPGAEWDGAWVMTSK